MSPLDRVKVGVVAGLSTVANGVLAVVRACLWPGRRPGEAQQVCVYRIGNVGDCVCAVPAINAVRRAYPKARLTLLTSPGTRGLPGAREVLAGAAWLDELLVYYDDDIESFAKRLRLLRDLRERSFDVWIELPSELFSLRILLRNMLVARLTGARYGYGWRLSRIRLALQAQATHFKFPNEVARLLAITRRAGIPSQRVAFPLPVDPADTRSVDRLLNELELRGRALVGVAPGAKRSPNRWPVERFAEVGRHIVAKGFELVAIGGESDRELCRRLVEGIGRGAANAAGRLSLTQCCELLKRCSLLLCNDSGVQHLAAAVGVPCISLFSCRDMKGKWWPWGPRNIVIQKWVECHTCYLEVCPYDNRCINSISTAEVMAAFDRQTA